MKKYAWFTLAVFVLISGCIPSLYPLYTDDTLAFDEKLVGNWQEEEEGKKDPQTGKIIYPQWHFKRSKKEKSYYLTHTTGEGQSSEYEVHLVKLGDRYYFDFYPDEDQDALDDLDDFLQFHLYPVHTFAKVEIREDQVAFYMFDNEWLDDLIEQRKIRIRHERADDLTLLSASTEELQQFVLKYGDDPNAYVDPVILVRND